MIGMMVRSIRTIFFAVALTFICGCKCPKSTVKATPPGEQTVVFELYVSKEDELPINTCLYIVTDNFVSGTRAGLLKKNSYEKGIIYSGKIVTIPGARRYFVVKLPRKNAEVFIMTAQATPGAIEWIPWAKPDFIDKSDEPTWSLQNSINVDQQVRNVPSSHLRLRYHAEQPIFP